MPSAILPALASWGSVLALLYLVVTVLLGDAICRRLYQIQWAPFRFASAFLVGLVVSSWTTYLLARIFAHTSNPLLIANLLFPIIGIGVAILLWRRTPGRGPLEIGNKWDLITIALFLICASWMMFSSFNMEGGKLQIANHQWSDFGPNVAIMQSFAFGHNFPTEYPHFAGDRIRYHFLFYFQAGNLEYLGLNPAWSNNLLSVLSLVSMLVVVIALGELLFKARLVGRIGAALFFFHGSLNYLAYFRRQDSLSNAVSETTQLKAFLPSGFPYRGEDWGVWSLVNFVNQRHFASAIGIFLLALVFVLARDIRREEASSWKQVLRQSGPFIVIGALIGLLPLWNGAVFLAAAAVFSVLFLLLRIKKQMLLLGLAAALVALPQIIYLKTGDVHPAGYSLFHWGYTIDDPTPLNTLRYLGWTFGFKWVAMGIALFVATWFQRRVMLAIFSLVVMAFLFQFSEEVLANHKFLNIWLIVANLFVAFGLWQLWEKAIKGNKLPARFATIALVFVITIGGVIDLFPIHNAHFVEIPFADDRLVRWTRNETDPKAVFLTDRVVTHRIMLAGRRIFHGWPYYTWGAGYLANERDEVYKRLFEETDAHELLNLLHQNNISYVAIDFGLRRGNFIKNLNEQVYANYFEKVFRDPELEYDGLVIYKVPRPGEALAFAPPVSEVVTQANAFAGGAGSGPARFDKPRGVTTDAAGNIYVADGGNSRVQKFSPKGDFVMSFGRPASAGGELHEPNGVAVDASGNVYVTDSVTDRVVKFKADGTLVHQWTGPEPGFYGPRDIAIASDNSLYVLDQGRSRVVRIKQNGEALNVWGRGGSGDAEFNGPTGLTIAGERVYVADAGNNRIQVFSLDGQYLTQWNIPRWDKYLWHFPDIAVDEQASRVYVSSGWTREVLVLDLNGNYLESIKPEREFNNASSLAVSLSSNTKTLYVLNTGTYAVEAGPPSVEAINLGTKD